MSKTSSNKALRKAAVTRVARILKTAIQMDLANILREWRVNRIRTLAVELESQEERVMIEVETVKWALDELQAAQRAENELRAARLIQAYIRGYKSRQKSGPALEAFDESAKVVMDLLTRLSHEVRVHLVKSATEADPEPVK